MNGLKRLLKRGLRAAGYDVTSYPPFSLGVCPFTDISRLVGASPDVVALDIGANRGQTAIELSRWLPHCQLHCFEPSPSTFRQLRDNLANRFPNIVLNNVALASTAGAGTFLENSISELSSFLRPDQKLEGEIVAATNVPISTVDDYCAEKGIARVHLLKVDTQGYELETIKGARSLIDRNRIKLIFLEIIFRQIYHGQPTLDQIFRYLVDRRFRMVAMYNFHFEGNVATYCDALFINPDFAASTNS